MKSHRIKNQKFISVGLHFGGREFFLLFGSSLSTVGNLSFFIARVDSDLVVYEIPSPELVN
jgi:hypothetical protein